MAGETIKTELNTYRKMKNELVEHHLGKFVVIHREQLLDAYDTLDAAATDAVKHFGKGPYLIRQVREEEKSVALPASLQFPASHATNN